MQTLIRSTPMLLARHLELLEGAQAEAAEACLAAADEAVAQFRAIGLLILALMTMERRNARRCL